MNKSPHQLATLSQLGANLLPPTQEVRVDTSVGIEALLKTLEQPRARAVGAVLQALVTLLAREDLVPAFDVLAPRAAPDALRRFGYLCERLATSPQGEGMEARLNALVTRAAVEPSTVASKEPLALSLRVRPSDRRRERDEVHRRWGVLAPRDVWTAFVH